MFLNLTFRGMAVEDFNSPDDVKLVIEDYPSTHSLSMTSKISPAIKYYKTDKMLEEDA